MSLAVEAEIKKARDRGATELSLADFYFWDLPDSICELTDLRTLDLSGTKITTLPAGMRRLERLSRLSIARAKLKSVPGVIEFLPQLEQLDLSQNQLKRLPDWLPSLSSLDTFDLSGNELTDLPDSIGRLQRLRRLILVGNKLEALPDTLAQSPALEELYLHGNEPLGLPPEMLGPTPEQVTTARATPADPLDILDYHRRLRLGSLPLNEAKIILVGPGEVGKTSLVRRLVTEAFDEHERKTEGIRITTWSIRLNRKERVRLNIWDFGGQEIMHATHQFFLTRRSIYLLVLNGRQGREDFDAEYWLKLIESFGDESHVIVVLNKIKGHPFDLNRRMLQEKYPAIRAFVRTDCSDGEGLAELRQSIERETDRLEHLRDAFPRSWFAIKDRLSGMQKNFLSYDEYRAFCMECGEQDKASQAALAGYLHNLGIALNYSDDSRLRDTHVLNPHWVTNGIYKILNAQTLERQKGTLHLDDLGTILDEVEYPSKMHRFLIDLMKKFGLCFSFTDDDDRVLIPELLGKEQPADTLEFDPSQCLNFQYHYSVLPEGLLSRFIVRTHIRSAGQPRWRTGVILEFEESRALVRADVQDRKILISVSGAVASRRRLLAIVRAYFEELHHHIPRLQPTAMVAIPDHPSAVIPYDKLVAMEREGVKISHEYVNDRIVHVDVEQLLNGVELEGMRPAAASTSSRGAVRLFYSYSHRDESLRDELETHLKLLQRLGLIEMWHDRKIDAGEQWRQAIDEHLDRADLILLLVSPDFFKSDYCWDKEMTRALERHENGVARVIPVIVRDVNWRAAPFAHIQALPTDAKAVALWGDKDSAWRNISESLEKIIRDMRSAAAS